MLSNLDAFAFQFLVLVANLIGINSLPGEGQGDWVIKEKWVETTDQTYQLHIENSKISAICNNEMPGHIVFPQTYMGQIEVLIDDQVVFTNSMTEKWNLYEMQSRPIVNCRTIKRGGVIHLKTNSYINFFASINHYPIIVREYPVSQIFYVDMFLLSATCALFLAIAGTILIARFGTLFEVLIYIMYQVSFSVVVISHISGKFVEISITASHTLFIYGALFALLSISLFNKTSRVMRIFTYILITFLFICNIFFSGYKNLTHVIIIFLIPSAMLLTFLLSIVQLKRSFKSKQYVAFSLYILIFLVIAIDSLYSQIYRNSFFHLSSIVFVSSMIAFYLILEKINRKNLEFAEANLKIAHDSSTIKKMSEIYSSYREIIHDIKSPLMSIVFFLGDPERHRSSISTISNRLKEIVNRVNDFHINRIADWYAFVTLEKLIQRVAAEKRVVYEKFDLKGSLETSIFSQVHYDPIDLTICIEEIFDNALKHGDGRVDMTHILSGGSLSISFSNKRKNEVDLSRENEEHILKGAGLGSMNMKKKLSLMGGDYSTVVLGNSFTCIVSLKAR